MQKKSNASIKGMAKVGITAITCLFVFQLYACGSIPVDSQNHELKDPTTPKTYVFACDEDFGFVANTGDNSAWLFLPTGTIKVHKISVEEYRSGEVALRIHGEDALLETFGGKQFVCRNNRRQAIWEHAKLNGADYRAIGNEPGWHLEIRNQSKIILVTEYGSARHEFDLPLPVTDTTSRTTRYEVTQDGQEVVLTISSESCLDSMSGEKFESSVEVILNGRHLNGCGRALH